MNSDYLIFIDTNILLDFYRMRKKDTSLKYLEEIDKHKDLIITTDQVEMEFYNNRQNAFNESISAINKIKLQTSIPPLLLEHEASKKLNNLRKDVEAQQKSLKTEIENILKLPHKHDPVYKSITALFDSDTEINLTYSNSKRDEIIKLATERFKLGYPPRKNRDTSIGDAFNWEWIISCSQSTQKNIIIVSRDDDFGLDYNNTPYLNDGLKQEFTKRVGADIEIILTRTLHSAFKLVNIPLTEEMIEEEDIVADKYKPHLNYFDQSKLIDAHIKNISEATSKIAHLPKRNWEEILQRLEHLNDVEFPKLFPKIRFNPVTGEYYISEETSNEND